LIIYMTIMMNLVLKWVIKQGGIAALEQQNNQKAKLVYDVVDKSEGFYQGFINPENRSDMNITWRLSSAELEQRFVTGSVSQGFEGLAGHRSIGGIRASAYNAVSVEACKALAEYMIDFQRKNC
jgi:phosphoserine aminotransferase